MPFIFREEGGDSNDAHDPGGKTHKGIIQTEYNAYRRKKGRPLQSVFAASDDEVYEIYWTQYWLPICPQLPDGVDLCQFNFGVNAGPVTAVKIMQRALHVADDGHYGLITDGAVKAADPRKLVYAFTLKEESYYRGLGTFRYFGKDWIGRSERCEALALKMIAETPQTTTEPGKPTS